MRTPISTDNDSTDVRRSTTWPDELPRRVGIDQFVEVVREAAPEGRDALEEALRSTWPTTSSVSEFVRLERGRCTRTLVYRDEAVEILVLGWAKGARSPIHNLAGQASWALTIRGALELT